MLSWKSPSGLGENACTGDSYFMLSIAPARRVRSFSSLAYRGVEVRYIVLIYVITGISASIQGQDKEVKLHKTNPHE